MERIDFGMIGKKLKPEWLLYMRCNLKLFQPISCFRKFIVGQMGAEVRIWPLSVKEFHKRNLADFDQLEWRYEDF